MRRTLPAMYDHWSILHCVSSLDMSNKAQDSVREGRHSVIRPRGKVEVFHIVHLVTSSLGVGRVSEK